MKKIRAKDVNGFFIELKKYVNNCLNKHLPNLKKEELEENGKIYYMNDKDDTIFNVSMNKHLCYFMCFYNDKENMGAIKVGVYMNGDIETCIYKNKESKPFVIEKTKINSDILNDVALALYVGADKKGLHGKSIDSIKFNNISESDKEVFYKSCGIVEVENETAKRYIDALENRYIECNKKDIWDKFKDNRKGANNAMELKKEYSKIPTSLISLLEYSDGTDIYFLGSDVDKGTYPYYLLSVKEILESKDKLRNNYGDFIDRSVKEFKVDERITNDINNFKWIHFADCMNNGGTSQLFIDLTPSEKGVKGQIIRYLHDPDSLEVIANSFDEYLNRQVKMGLKFIDKENEIEKKEEVVEVKEEPKKEESNNKIKDFVANKKLELLLIGLILISLVNMVMAITQRFNNVLTTILLFVALSGIFALFIYLFIRLLKNNFSPEGFNILLILNMLFSLQYIGNFTVVNIILALINLGLSAYGLNLIEKYK